MQARIPPEFRHPQKTVVPITGLDKTPAMENHDPSNLIFHNGLYYRWYTEHHIDTDGFKDCYIKYATSPNGLHWQVRGVALQKGEPDGPDAQGVLTTYIVPDGGKWYMFFLAVGPEFENPHISPRGLWLAVSDTPDGPGSNISTHPYYGLVNGVHGMNCAVMIPTCYIATENGGFITKVER